MKPERKHIEPEHESNLLADGLVKFFAYCRENVVLLGAMAAVFVLVLVGYNLVLTEPAVDTPAGPWLEYLEALGDNDPAAQLESFASSAAVAKSPAGSWGKIALADKQLDKATKLLFEDREAADKALRDAKENYQAEEASRDSELRNRARLGLAQVHEAQNNLDDATKYYELVMKESPESPYGKAAAKGHKRLASSSNREFVAWFGKQKPVKRTTTQVPLEIPDMPNFEHPTLPGGAAPSGKSSLFPDLEPEAKFPVKDGPKSDKPADASNDDSFKLDAPKTDAPKAEAPKTEEPAKTEPAVETKDEAKVETPAAEPKK